MNDFESNLKNIRVAIVTHVYATGPAQELEDYLKVRVKELIFIGHPFRYSHDTRSFYKIYKNGVLIKTHYSFNYKAPEIILYCKDVFYSLLWLFFRKGNLDLYVGADPLNGFAGFILKGIGRVKKTVLYTIDYVPRRFNNKVLNWVYHRLDSCCVRNSDFVWNLSARMTEERKKKGILKTSNQIVVPIGVNFDRIQRRDNDKINRYYLVYMGHIKKHQGLELIINSLKDIINKVPKAKLLIVGGGDLKEHLKDLVAKNYLGKYVEFKDYIPDHRDVESILSGCAIGLALYEPDPYSITWYADPSKPKQYMASGLPVIITSVPAISDEIKSKRLGLVVNYNKESFVNGVFKLLLDNKFYFECRKNVIEFSSTIRWETIFSNALLRCL